MRIALVSPYDIGVPSGVNVHVLNAGRVLRDRGHEVTCFFPGQPGFKPPEGAETIGRPFPVRSGGSVARIALSPFLGGAIQQALDNGRFDVVHLHEPLTPMLPLQFLRKSKSLKVGTFHASHDGGDIRYRLARPLLSRFVRLLDGRLAVSPAAARLALRYFPGDYKIIPNGIDVGRFRTQLPLPAGLAGKTPYVLFVGRFEERKGLPILLEAFAEVEQGVPGAHLVVVGAGALRKRYEAWVQREGLRRVHFAGYVSDDDLPAYYQHSAVSCAPNTGNESFGIVLIEAMAAGCPVVASNIEGFAELTVYGAHGLLVAPKSPRALADALRRILTDEKLRAATAARGTDHVEQFDWPVVADQVLAFYAEVAARRGITLPA
ncbi:MAG: glycosyltransferase family 4 protein [Dehalococcoidia bacterium]